jgi:S1-C subfamily serine protease
MKRFNLIAILFAAAIFASVITAAHAAARPRCRNVQVPVQWVFVPPPAPQVENSVANEPEEEWGMKVTEVHTDGAAGNAGLMAGDIILSVAGNRVQTFEELVAALGKSNGPMEFVFINCENQKMERMMIAPIDGKIGIATHPVVVD